jgi:hypothetical protein
MKIKIKIGFNPAAMGAGKALAFSEGFFCGGRP